MQWQPAAYDETARFRRSKRQEAARMAVLVLCLQGVVLLAVTLAAGLFFGEFLGRIQTPFGSLANVGLRFGQLVFLAFLLWGGLRLAAAWRQSGKATWYVAQGVCTDWKRELEYRRDWSSEIHGAYRKSEWVYMVIHSDSGKKVYKLVSDSTITSDVVGRRVTMATTTPEKVYPEFVHVHPPRPE